MIIRELSNIRSRRQAAFVASLLVTIVTLLFVLPSMASTAPTLLLTWGSGGTGPGQFNIPRSAATDAAGNVYIADFHNHRIQKFDSNGNFLSSWGSFGTSPGQFREPASVAIKGGTRYVVDHLNHRVQMFDLNGIFMGTFGTKGFGVGQLYFPLGIDVDSSGNIYVGEKLAHRVKIFNAAGTQLGVFGSFGSGPGQFNQPHDVALDAGGNVYVVSRQQDRVQKFTSTGTFISQWGTTGTGPGQFNEPTGLAVGPFGSIFVSDEMNDRVQVFDSAGTYLLEWSSPIRPFELAVHTDGIIYVPQVTQVINKYSAIILNQPPDCSAAYADPDLLWPPDHKFENIYIIGVTDPEGDAITLNIDSIFQDEPVDAKGSGHTAPDGQGVGTTTAQVRAERVGGGDGRVYHIAFTADDGNGGTCNSEVTVGVRPNQESTPVDGGALFDSTLLP